MNTPEIDVGYILKRLRDNDELLLVRLIESQQSTNDAQRAEIERLSKELDNAVNNCQLCVKIYQKVADISTEQASTISVMIKQLKRFEGCVPVDAGQIVELATIFHSLPQVNANSQEWEFEANSYFKEVFDKFLTANEVGK